MGKLVTFRPKRDRRAAARKPVALALDETLLDDVDLGNLIDAWIVPKMLDDWMSRIEDTEPIATEDNGEHR